MATTTRPTLTSMVEGLPLTLRIIDGPTRTTDDDGWEHDAWNVRIVHAAPTRRPALTDHVTPPETRTMPVAWRAGTGHQGRPPELAEVMAAVVSDSRADDDFATWCEEYGYDTDSRRAYATWQRCGDQRNMLQNLVGGYTFDLLMSAPQD